MFNINAQCYHSISEYIRSLANVSFHIGGPHVHAVSVVGKKSDAVCGFWGYFCAVLRFSDPPPLTPPPFRKAFRLLEQQLPCLFTWYPESPRRARRANFAC